MKYVVYNPIEEIDHKFSSLSEAMLYSNSNLRHWHEYSEEERKKLKMWTVKSNDGVTNMSANNKHFALKQV